MRSRESTAAVAALDAVRTSTGHEPSTCPWRAFASPAVREVMRDHAYYEQGQVREAWGADPPAWRVLALDVFRRAIDSARADVLDAERAARERG